MKPPGGVEHVGVVAAEPGLDLGAPGDGDRALSPDDGQRVDADLAAENLQLLHRGRARHVERGHQHALAVALLEAQGDLRGRGRLARALKPHHEDRRGRAVDAQLAGILVPLQRLDQRIVDDLDHLLPRGHRLDHLLPGGARAHPLDEVAGHGKRDVGLEQGDAHLAHGRLDVLLADDALAGEALHRAGQALGQVLEHLRASRPRLSATAPPSRRAPQKPPRARRAGGGRSRPDGQGTGSGQTSGVRPAL